MSPDEFIRSKCGSCITLNNGFAGSLNPSKVLQIMNPSKEFKLPTSKATLLLNAPSRDPSSQLGRKGT